MTVRAYIRTQRILVDPADNSVTIVNAGPQGPAGPSGSGVPAGGLTGEVLVKDSNIDGDVSWQELEAEAANGIPVGGTLAQILAKVSSGDFDTEWVDPPIDGVDGADGADGAPGVGVPSGGTTGQYLAKDTGADFDTSWVNGPTNGVDGADGIGVPSGGTTGQVLAKNSGTDFDTEWIPPPADGVDGADGADGADGVGVPTGGSTGQVLGKVSGTNFDTAWLPPPADGADGTDGVGVPTGGTSGQVLAKVDGTDYNTEWAAPGAAANGLPTGGTTNQILAKDSATDFDADWVDAPAAVNGLPTGGATNQILSKSSGTDFDADWVDEEVEMQYVEGTTEPAIEGTAILWEDAADTLTTVSDATPLPVADASVAATLASILSDVADMLTSLQLIDNTVSGTELQVDVLTLPSLPAGSNNIGDVDVLTLPALPAGNNNIGDVDVASSALPTGASTSANQTTIIGHVDGIEGVLTTIDADTSALAGAVSGTEMQVDVVTLPSLPAGTNNIGDVDVLSSALPTGASTSAKQDTIIGHVDGIETVLATIDSALSAIKTSVQLLDDTVGGTELQVDVLTLPALAAGTNNIGDVDVLTLPALPAGTNAIGKLAANSGVDIGDVDVTSCALPTGAATSAKQDTEITSLQLIDDIVYTDDTSTHATGTSKGALLMAAAAPTDASVDTNDIGAVAMTTARALHTSVQTALPAGTNAIGKLAANSGVDIGDVDVTSLPALAAGTNLIGKVGADAVSSATLSNVTCSTTVATLASSNASRKGLIIFNDTGQILYVKFGATATTSSYTLKIPDQAVYEIPLTGLYTGQVTGILSTGSGSARITEL